MNDCQILEISSDEPQSSSVNKQHSTHQNELLTLNEVLTVPPSSNKKINPVVETSEVLDCILCCCQYGAHGEVTNPNKTPQNTTSSCYDAAIWKRLMSSTYLYLYVLFMTAICSFLLILEVLLDSKKLQVVSTSTISTTVSPSDSLDENEATKHLSAVLHWISFTIICLFLIEVVIRLSLWRVEALRNPIALCDSAVIVCSFTANVTTSIAAGIDSPWDAISLLILVRLVRVYSLLQAGNRRSINSLHYVDQVQMLQVDLSTLQVTNNKLQKQIKDKDFEIKQLVAHLGGGNVELDEEIKQVVETSKLRSASNTTPSDYEMRLQQAIERSRSDYVNGQGFVNYSYTEKNNDENGEGVQPVDVIIHHRQNSIKEGDLEDCPGTSKQPAPPASSNTPAAPNNGNYEQDTSSLFNDNMFDQQHVPPQWNQQQNINQFQISTPQTSTSTKLVKINPKDLQKPSTSDQQNRVSRWIYRKQDDDMSFSSEDDEGIESTPSSLKRKIRRSPTETLSTSTNPATDGTLSDHGFSSNEVEAVVTSSQPHPNKIITKSNQGDDIEMTNNHHAIDEEQVNDSTVSVV